MKNFFRFTFFATFFTIFSFSLFSCKNESDDENPSVESVASKGGLIAFYPPNGLGDASYVDSFCSGVQKAALKNNLLVYDICPKNWDEAKDLVDEYISRCYELTKTYNLPVFFLFGDEGYLEFFSPYLIEKPDTISYMLFESKETEFPAVNTAYMPLYGASYLAGLASKTLLEGRENARILAILANGSTQSVKDALKGFIAGSDSESAWNEKVYDYNFTEWSDSDSTGFEELNFVAVSLNNEHDKDGFDSADLSYALALFAQKLNPFDLYFPVCGGSVHGLLRYNREKGEKSFYTVGMDSDLSVYTKQVPFSVVKHIDRAVQKCIEQWLSGKLPHHQEFDLANGYTGLVISEKYKEKLSAAVQGALARAIEKEREYEENK
ncbi:MAG: hypothetical protein IJT42_06795 [Treponema sp.]|nr:hypothetical protein [Treponema sp.]